MYKLLRVTGATLLMLLLSSVALNDALPYKTYTEVMATWIKPSAPMTHSDYLPFTLAANTPEYDVNMLGYRGIYPTQITRGTKPRVLLMGDSFTWGHLLSYADSYAGQLQALLPAVEIINAGYHCANSPDAYYACLVREGLALQPDWIVLNIFTINDVLDMQETVWTATDATGAPTSLYTLRLYPDLRGGIVNADVLPWYYSIPGLRDRRLWVGMGELVTRGAGRLAEPVPLPETYVRFRVTFEGFAALANETGIPVLVNVFDTRDHWDDARHEAGERVIADTLTLTIPADRVLDGIGGYTDNDWLLPDGHLNREGSAVMARRVADWLSGIMEG
jgi:hypothetical protein